MQTQTHILVIDDDPIHTKMVSYLLAEHGYTVTVLTDPRGVLDTIRQQAVDLIFMEVALPYQDGFSLCAQLEAPASRYARRLPLHPQHDADQVRASRKVPTTTSGVPTNPPNCSPASRRPAPLPTR